MLNAHAKDTRQKTRGRTQGTKAHTKAQAGDTREEAYAWAYAGETGRRDKREKQAGERRHTGRRHEAEDRFAESRGSETND